MYAIRSYYGIAIGEDPLVLHLEAELALHLPREGDLDPLRVPGGHHLVCADGGAGETEHVHACRQKEREILMTLEDVITSYSIHYTKLYDEDSSS